MVFYILGGSILVTFIACLIHYFATDSDFSDFFVENGGWVTIAMCATVTLGIVGCIYLDLWISLIIMLTVIATFIACIFHYNDSCSSDLSSFFVDELGWLTNLIILTIGLTIYGCVYTRVATSLYIGISAIVFMVACAIHYSEQSCSGFEDFFINEKGWITVSITLLVEFSLYGFIFWSPAKTFIVISTIISVIIGTIIHWNAGRCSDIEDFFYKSNGFITVFIIGTIGYGVFAFAYYEILRAVISVLALSVSIVGTIIHKAKAKERYFVSFYAVKLGVLTFTLPLIIGGVLVLAIYSKYAYLVSFALLGIISYICSLIKARGNRTRYYAPSRPPVSVSAKNAAGNSVNFEITEIGEIIYR